MNDDERETAALLGQLKVTPSEAARTRAFAKLQQEFQSQHTARKPRARWALAAGVAALAAVGVSWLALQPQVLGVKVEALDGAVVARGSHWYSRAARLENGAQIAAGDSVSVGDDAGVLLRVSGDLTVRLAAGSHARLTAADEIELSVGQAFVDATPGARAPLRVVTPHGVVTHLGTQYLVRSGHDEIEVAVREGRAQLTTGKATTVAEAGSWLLRRDAESAPRVGELAPVDARFDWIATLPSEFHLEGATLAQFLAWFQRETGLATVYSEGVDAGNFAHVQLKGSIDDLDPLEALSYVLATADLAWHREGPKVIIEKPPAAGG